MSHTPISLQLESRQLFDSGHRVPVQPRPTETVDMRNSAGTDLGHGQLVVSVSTLIRHI